MRVLLSIKPTHVGKILSGTKTFEFRRRIFARADVARVLIYSTQPVGRVVGEFELMRVIRDRPSRLWRRTRHGSGISKAYFDRYFFGLDEGYALQIGRVRTFLTELDPNDIIADFTPPQSYRYVDDDQAFESVAENGRG